MTELDNSGTEYDCIDIQHVIGQVTQLMSLYRSNSLPHLQWIQPTLRMIDGCICWVSYNLYEYLNTYNRTIWEYMDSSCTGQT
jgi:hypothetical protein